MMVVTILTVGAAEGTSHFTLSPAAAGSVPSNSVRANTGAVMCRLGELHTPCFGGMVPAVSVIIQFTIHILVSAEYSLLLTMSNHTADRKHAALETLNHFQDHESNLNN